jgi:hypothetical protein
MDLVAGVLKQAHAPATTERHSIGHDKVEPPQAGPTPKLNDKRSAESITKRQNPGSCSNLSTGPFGLSEQAVVRLEAALRAQRESLAENEGLLQTPDAFNSQPPSQRAPERLQSTEPLPAVENDVDRYLSQLASSSERVGADKRLPRAMPLPPVTGLPPVEENAFAETVPRADETFIDGLRVPPSLVAERPLPPPSMQRHRNNFITPLLMTSCAVAVLIAYFSVRNLIPESESGRGPQLALLDSRIVAPPTTTAALQRFRPDEAQDSTAAVPPDNEIASQGAIISQVKTSQIAALSQGTTPSQSPVSRSAKSPQATTSSQSEGSPRGETTATLSPGPGDSQTPQASKTVRRLDPEDIKRLIKQGEQFAATGDLVTARLVFQRAAEAGDATAALAMGASYDPIVLAKLGFWGIRADVAKARSWYEKAKEFGSSEAPRRLELLASR